MTEDPRAPPPPASSGSAPSSLAQRAASPTPTVSVAASDFYGPPCATPTRASAWCPRCWPAGPCGWSAASTSRTPFTYVPRPRRRHDPRRGRPAPVELVPARPHRPPGHPARARRAGRGGGGVPCHGCRPSPPWALGALGVVVSRDPRARGDGVHVHAPLRAGLHRGQGGSDSTPDAARVAVKETVDWWRTRPGDSARRDLVADHRVARRRRRLGLGRVVAGDRREDPSAPAPQAREHGGKGAATPGRISGRSRSRPG